MNRRGRWRATLLAVVAFSLTIAPFGAPVGAAPAAPSHGHDVVQQGPIADGVTYEHRRLDGPVSVHTVRIHPGAPVGIRPVVAGEQVGSIREPVSSMCARAGGVACVNASYPKCPSCSVPHGAIVMNSVLVQTPEPGQTQIAMVDGKMRADWHWPWSAGLWALGADAVPSVAFDAINGAHRGDGIVVRTRAWGTHTGSPAGSYELVIRAPEALRTGPGVRQQAEFLRVHTAGNAEIPEGGAVITGTGTGADRLWAFVETHRRSLVELVVNTPEGLEMAFSGHPILLAGGKPAELDSGDGKVVGRHPRTVIGWNEKTGNTWLVVVDGRREASVGMTLRRVAEHLRSMGASDAINLDGGGSSTMVTSCPSDSGFCVRNVPSDGRQRPVWVGLAVIPQAKTEAAPAPQPPPTTVPTVTVPIGPRPASTAPVAPLQTVDPTETTTSTRPAIEPRSANDTGAIAAELSTGESDAAVVAPAPVTTNDDSLAAPAVLPAPISDRPRGPIALAVLALAGVVAGLVRFRRPTA